MSRRDKTAGAPAVEAPPAEPDVLLPSAETAPAEPVASPEAAPAAEAPTAAASKPKAKAVGHTICKVINTAIYYHGNLIPEGTVAEFDDATVLEMPTVLEPQE